MGSKDMWPLPSGAYCVDEGDPLTPLSQEEVLLGPGLATENFAFLRETGRLALSSELSRRSPSVQSLVPPTPSPKSPSPPRVFCSLRKKTSFSSHSFLLKSNIEEDCEGCGVDPTGCSQEALHGGYFTGWPEKRRERRVHPPGFLYSKGDIQIIQHAQIRCLNSEPGDPVVPRAWRSQRPLGHSLDSSPIPRCSSCHDQDPLSYSGSSDTFWIPCHPDPTSSGPLAFQSVSSKRNSSAQSFNKGAPPVSAAASQGPSYRGSSLYVGPTQGELPSRSQSRQSGGLLRYPHAAQGPPFVNTLRRPQLKCQSSSSLIAVTSRCLRHATAAATRSPVAPADSVEPTINSSRRSTEKRRRFPRGTAHLLKAAAQTETRQGRSRCNGGSPSASLGEHQGSRGEGGGMGTEKQRGTGLKRHRKRKPSSENTRLTWSPIPSLVKIIARATTRSDFPFLLQQRRQQQLDHKNGNKRNASAREHRSITPQEAGDFLSSSGKGGDHPGDNLSKDKRECKTSAPVLASRALPSPCGLFDSEKQRIEYTDLGNTTYTRAATSTMRTTPNWTAESCSGQRCSLQPKPARDEDKLDYQGEQTLEATTLEIVCSLLAGNEDDSAPAVLTKTALEHASDCNPLSEGCHEAHVTRRLKNSPRNMRAVGVTAEALIGNVATESLSSVSDASAPATVLIQEKTSATACPSAETSSSALKKQKETILNSAKEARQTSVAARTPNPCQQDEEEDTSGATTALRLIAAYRSRTLGDPDEVTRFPFRDQEECASSSDVVSMKQQQESPTVSRSSVPLSSINVGEGTPGVRDNESLPNREVAGLRGRGSCNNSMVEQRLQLERRKPFRFSSSLTLKPRMPNALSTDTEESSLFLGRHQQQQLGVLLKTNSKECTVTAHKTSEKGLARSVMETNDFPTTAAKLPCEHDTLTPTSKQPLSTETPSSSQPSLEAAAQKALTDQPATAAAPHATASVESCNREPFKAGSDLVMSSLMPKDKNDVSPVNYPSFRQDKHFAESGLQEANQRGLLKLQELQQETQHLKRDKECLTQLPCDCGDNSVVSMLHEPEGSSSGADQVLVMTCSGRSDSNRRSDSRKEGATEIHSSGSRQKSIDTCITCVEGCEGQGSLDHSGTPHPAVLSWGKVKLPKANMDKRTIHSGLGPVRILYRFLRQRPPRKEHVVRKDHKQRHAYHEQLREKSQTSSAASKRTIMESPKVCRESIESYPQKPSPASTEEGCENDSKTAKALAYRKEKHTDNSRQGGCGKLSRMQYASERSNENKMVCITSAARSSLPRRKAWDGSTCYLKRPPGTTENVDACSAPAGRVAACESSNTSTLGAATGPAGRSQPCHSRAPSSLKQGTSSSGERPAAQERQEGVSAMGKREKRSVDEEHIMRLYKHAAVRRQRFNELKLQREREEAERLRREALSLRPRPPPRRNKACAPPPEFPTFPSIRRCCCGNVGSPSSISCTTKSVSLGGLNAGTCARERSQGPQSTEEAYRPAKQQQKCSFPQHRRVYPHAPGHSASCLTRLSERKLLKNLLQQLLAEPEETGKCSSHSLAHLMAQGSQGHSKRQECHSAAAFGTGAGTSVHNAATLQQGQTSPHRSLEQQHQHLLRQQQRLSLLMESLEDCWGTSTVAASSIAQSQQQGVPVAQAGPNFHGNGVGEQAGRWTLPTAKELVVVPLRISVSSDQSEPLHERKQKLKRDYPAPIRPHMRSTTCTFTTYRPPKTAGYPLHTQQSCRSPPDANGLQGRAQRSLGSAVSAVERAAAGAEQLQEAPARKDNRSQRKRSSTPAPFVCGSTRNSHNILLQQAASAAEARLAAGLSCRDTRRSCSTGALSNRSASLRPRQQGTLTLAPRKQQEDGLRNPIGRSVLGAQRKRRNQQQQQASVAAAAAAADSALLAAEAASAEAEAEAGAVQAVAAELEALQARKSLEMLSAYGSARDSFQNLIFSGEEKFKVRKRDDSGVAYKNRWKEDNDGQGFELLHTTASSLDLLQHAGGGMSIAAAFADAAEETLEKYWAAEENPYAVP